MGDNADSSPTGVGIFVQKSPNFLKNTKGEFPAGYWTEHNLPHI